jgi:hypothetical protein
MSIIKGTEQAVPLTLELAQTVVVGAFNPYVITPDWLVRFGFYREDEGVNVRLVPLGQGAAFEVGCVEWQVDNQRLSVASSERSEDCGGTVSRVLSLLPHTPVQALGHNFHFSATREEWGGRPAPMLGGRGLQDFTDAEQVRWVGAFRLDETRIEATLAYEMDAVAILLNHHRTMDLERARRARTAEEQVAQARGAAEKFREDFEVSRKLLRSFFEMEFPDG